MNKEMIQRIHRIYNRILSVLIIIAGICFITACLGIYQSGDQPYSREAVAVAFSGIALPVYLCLVMIVGGFIFELFDSTETVKFKTPKAYLHIIGQLRSKRNLSDCTKELRIAIESEEKSRKLHQIISLVVLGISSAIFLIYALNGAHFHQSEINTSMIQAMYRFIPCIAISFGYAIFTLYHNRKSYEKEIELLKQLPVLKSSVSIDTQKTDKQASAETKHILIFRSVFLCLSFIILIYGFISGGTADVLTKAINICTECIGLG